ncbi:hypothetical protein M378DRAFT_733369 [Amanita muscaria Koide BX008]|uniref:tyrosinase n=1 Tax=Amanita muscaria (strain Koide BX008) TaxID=946122 RepID=A0A0C2WNA9_AMAMK|nr:hypothetical protein M378DRAFT_733369 [Amanita muscaria Koide BX008]
MQSADASDDKSFYAVSGIHGQPYTAWNGATGTSTASSPASEKEWNFGGYCTHGSVLFPTWHRPYLALFEQIIQEHAIEIATRFDFAKQSWKDTAIALRLPYWDWVANAVPPDFLIRDETITILDFDGSSIKVGNPFLRYHFRETDCQLFDPPFNHRLTTLRHPDDEEKEDEEKLVQTMKSLQAKIVDDTIALLTLVHDWTHFSNHTAQDFSLTNSLEAIHDIVHCRFGGGGHMSEVAVAAFDPIFYMHHCNIDRLLAIWLALNQGKGVCSGKNDDGGTFTLPPQTDVDECTELAPFWKTQDTFWCSKHLYNTEVLGYSYPELGPNDQYAIYERVEVAQALVTKYIEGSPGGIFASSDMGRWWNWAVRIRARKFELGRSFSIMIFLGGVPTDPTDWSTSDSLAGVHHVFANSSAGRCPNCRKKQNTINEGFVHLNRHLLQMESVLPAGLDPSHLQGWLMRRIKWRVTDETRRPVELESLEVALMAIPLTRHPDTKLPTVDNEIPIFFNDMMISRSCCVIT